MCILIVYQFQVVQTLFLSVGLAAHTGTYINYIINIRWCNILLKTNGKCKMHIMYMCSKNYYDRLFFSVIHIYISIAYVLYPCTIFYYLLQTEFNAVYYT